VGLPNKTHWFLVCLRVSQTCKNYNTSQRSLVVEAVPLIQQAKGSGSFLLIQAGFLIQASSD